MRTDIDPQLLTDPDVKVSEEVLRACVHCGFCNATCPTYLLTGNELEGPRGRIYLIKNVLENGIKASHKTIEHIDNCLGCLACETTCPSGVNYSRLVELARPLVDKKVDRGRIDKIKRWLICLIVPYPRRFAAVLFLPQLLKRALPRVLNELIPAKENLLPAQKQSNHQTKMILLDGCVQRNTGSNINAAAKDIFDCLGVQLLSNSASGCCGAVSYHLGQIEEAKHFARQNIDAWTEALNTGAQAVVSTSSGCTVMLKEYASLLRDDLDYAARAERVTELVRDPAEVLDVGLLGESYQVPSSPRIAFHPPCTQQHGLGVSHHVRGV